MLVSLLPAGVPLLGWAMWTGWPPSPWDSDIHPAECSMAPCERPGQRHGRQVGRGDLSSHAAHVGTFPEGRSFSTISLEDILRQRYHVASLDISVVTAISAFCSAAGSDPTLWVREMVNDMIKCLRDMRLHRHLREQTMSELEGNPHGKDSHLTGRLHPHPR